ncbi:hypothetical protein C6A88_18550 [Mycolicibacterium austroafricanum]|nr:hypothetical protein C6A88_18550 [Mycolicibacterium austroafricanum]
MHPVTTKEPGGCNVKFGFRARIASVAGAAAFATLIAAAPSASADPAAPAPAPLPVPGPAVPDSAPLPAPVAAPMASPVPAPLAAPIAGPASVQSLAAGPVEPVAEGVPHLASPENLPPGTSTTPTQQSRLGYLRDLWHAMQTQEVSGSNALLLLTQRPLSSSPSAGMPAGPQPVAPPAPAPVAPPVVP